MATDYATKWVETEALHTNNTVVITKFLYENILTRLGCPLIIVNNQGTHFIMMQLDTLLTILSSNIPVLLCIIYKEMDRLSLQTRFLETY